MLNVWSCVAPVRIGVVLSLASKEWAIICCVTYLIATMASKRSCNVDFRCLGHIVVGRSRTQMRSGEELT